MGSVAGIVKRCKNITRKVVKYLHRRKIDLNEKLFDSYISFSDISFLETLIKNAFNYDIKKGFSCASSASFYIHLFWFSVLCLFYARQTIGCFIHWGNQAMITTTGCFYPGLAFPRETTIVCGAMCLVCSLIKFGVSIKVVKKDNNLAFTMEPLMALLRITDERHLNSRTLGEKCHLTFSKETLERVREEMRPMIVILRMATVAVPISYFLIALASFLLYHEEPITHLDWLLFVHWSAVFGGIQFHNVWRASALIVFMNNVMKLTRATFVPPGGCNGMEQPSASTLPTPFAIGRRKLLEQIQDGMNVVTSVRKFNQFTKLIFGADFALIFTIATVGTFSLITTEVNAPYIGCCVVVCFIWCVLVGVCYFPAKTSDIIRQRVVELSVLSVRTKLSVLERYRIERTLEGMRHLNTFSIFDFWPEIKHMMTITVSMNAMKR